MPSQPPSAIGVVELAGEAVVGLARRPVVVVEAPAQAAHGVADDLDVVVEARDRAHWRTLSMCDGSRSTLVHQ